MLIGWIVTAHAGVVAGVLTTIDVPLALDSPHHAGSQTSSSTGAGLALSAGWCQSAGPVHVQPELVARLDPFNGVSLLGGGLSLSAGDKVAGGAAFHIGWPVYFGPAWDVSAFAEGRFHDHVRPRLGVGYTRASIAHYKCGSCPQPADHFLSVRLGATFDFGP